jgi:hypothetical protein
VYATADEAGQAQTTGLQSKHVLEKNGTTMTDQITYIDGLGRVRLANGMAHIELVAAFPSEEENKVDVRPVHNLVIPLGQFVKLCSDMANNLARMEEKGIITRKEPQGAGAGQ